MKVLKIDTSHLPHGKKWEIIINNKSELNDLIEYVSNLIKNLHLFKPTTKELILSEIEQILDYVTI